MISYQIKVIPKWVLKGYPLYFIDENNKLRNWNTGKELKMQLKGYTKGYYIGGGFKSLSQLRTLLEKYEPVELPF